MSKREVISDIAERWISLWTVSVDWRLFDSIHADDFEDMSSAGRPGTKEGFAQGLRDLVRAFPDFKTKVDDLVIDIERSQVAIRWSAHGTNKERYLGVGPTNKLTKITGIEIIELRNDTITRRWGEWDITRHALTP